MNPRNDASGSNPFSTRFIRPGAIPYFFPTGQSAADLVEKLAADGGRGQIIGPHGSGKSTLIASLIDPFQKAGRPVCLFCLHDGQRHLPADWSNQASRVSAPTIVVDGYEQLSPWSRWKLKLVCRRRQWVLIVTAHRNAGFPTLFRTEPSLDAAAAVVERLQAGRDKIVSGQVVAETFAKTDGNVREMLFSLYDVFERQHALR